MFTSDCPRDRNLRSLTLLNLKMIGAILVIFASLWIFLISIKRQPISKTRSLMIILGSGGHTAEMFKLIQGLGKTRFTKRVYIMAESDKTSSSKLQAFELDLTKSVVLKIPRSRKVHQSWITTPFTTLFSIISCVRLVYFQDPDLIICNGPGTCIPICFISGALRLINLSNTKILFVESFARVVDLSLTGKILYKTGIVDRFIVHWPLLHVKYPRSEYLGQLM